MASGLDLRDIIMLAIGFVLVIILTPIGMQQIIGTSTTSWNSAVVTMWQVLLPILYIIGAALYMIPKIRGGKD